MIIQIKQYIAAYGLVSLRDSSIKFEMDEAALEPILERLIAQGVIAQIASDCGQGCQSGCAGCPSATASTYYQYVKK